MTDEIPQWAVKEALKRSNLFNSPCLVAKNKDMAWSKAVNAFASYIAQHEEPPVDPLLIEAREIVAKYFDERGNSRVAKTCRSGDCDTTGTLQMTIEGLRRGIELGKAGAA